MAPYLLPVYFGTHVLYIFWVNRLLSVYFGIQILYILRSVILIHICLQSILVSSFYIFFCSIAFIKFSVLSALFIILHRILRKPVQLILSSPRELFMNPRREFRISSCIFPLVSLYLLALFPFQWPAYIYKGSSRDFYFSFVSPEAPNSYLSAPHAKRFP